MLEVEKYVVTDSNLLFPIQRGEAYSLLLSMKQEIERNVNTSVFLDSQIDCLIGATEIISGQVNGISIGVKGLEPRVFRNRTKVDTNSVVGCIVAGFHEQQHCIQCRDIFNKAVMSERELVMALGFGVSQYNRDFYLYPDNYRHLLHEIDAEKNGLQNGLQFLSNHLSISDNECEQLILNYVNEKCKVHKANRTKYFISGDKYTSLQDVFIDFDRTLRHAINTPYNYFSTKGYGMFNDVCGNRVRDYIQIFDKRISYDVLGVNFLRDEYLKQDSALDCLMFLGCITKHVYSDFDKGLLLLQHVDLSPEHVIGISLPMNPEDVDIQEIQEFRQRNHVLTESEKRALELDILFGNRFDEPDVNIDNENSFSIF